MAAKRPALRELDDLTLTVQPPESAQTPGSNSQVLELRYSCTLCLQCITAYIWGSLFLVLISLSVSHNFIPMAKTFYFCHKCVKLTGRYKM